MLEEKKAHYGERSGFFENNARGKYDHAIGEARLKLREFERTKDLRMLIKAVTWLYLVYEVELNEKD
jgi:hypothetical protein